MKRYDFTTLTLSSLARMVVVGVVVVVVCVVEAVAP